jgi:hypothetical protein
MNRKTKTRPRLEHQWVCRVPRDEREVRRAKRGSALPSMTFSGAWLRRAGFVPGARILIMVQCRGQLIIERLR